MACLEGGMVGVSRPDSAAGSSSPASPCCQPSLVRHLQYRLQSIRDRQWVMVRNTLSGQHVRLDARLWRVLQQLDGQLRLDRWIARHADSFTEASLLEALAHLQRQGLLMGMPELTNPSAAGSLFNPLMVRLPLCDPSTLLQWLARKTALIRARWLLLSLLMLIGLSLLLTLLNWQALLLHWQQMIAAPQQWWQYLLLYPCMKVLHELAHGLVLSRLGGNVREAGLSLLVLMPMPYVDASESWMLPRRRHRMAVTAAGMISDLVMASLALLAWLTVSPGVLSDMAFAVMLMGCVSVLIFNGNPLLKFDGYHLLEDLLDSPGLMRRSQSYWLYLCQRHLLALDEVQRPLVAAGERRWLLPFGLASMLYRLVISVVIAFFLISTFHEIGWLLAAFTLVPTFLRPPSRLLGWLVFSALPGPEGPKVLRRLALPTLLLLPIALLPLPSSTRTEGVVWSASQSEVFAAEGGELQQLAVDDGQRVEADQVLLQLLAPELVLERSRQQSRIALLELEHQSIRGRDPANALKRRLEIESLQENLKRLERRIEALTVRAPRQGRIALSPAGLVEGQRVSRGELLMYLVDDAPAVIRAVLDQRQLGRVQAGVTSAQVRLAADITESHAVTVSRELPAGDHRLPSMALADDGFGGIDVHTADGQLQTRQQVFHLELQPEQAIVGQSRGLLGERAFVSLNHPKESLGRRWYRSARQLLLRHLGAWA